MPAISFPPLALPFFVLVADGAEPVPLAVDVPVLVGTLELMLSVSPILGKATSPATNHPPAVLLGQAGGVKLGVYAEEATPVGVSVAHCDWRFVKSGVIGIGVPVTENPP